MKVKDLVDDDYIIEVIESGGTYEDLAEHYGIDLHRMTMYCVNRGYIYKNRGNLKKVDSARVYFGKFVKECPQCHKVYNCYNPGEWAWCVNYKKTKYYMCGWNCVRAFEREKGIE